MNMLNNNNISKKGLSPLINNNLNNNDRLTATKKLNMLPSQTPPSPTTATTTGGGNLSTSSSSVPLSSANAGGGAKHHKYNKQSHQKGGGGRYSKSGGGGGKFRQHQHDTQELQDEIALALEMSKVEYEIEQEKMRKSTGSVDTSAPTTPTKTNLSLSGGSIKNTPKKKNQVDVTHLLSFNSHKEPPNYNSYYTNNGNHHNNHNNNHHHHHNNHNSHNGRNNHHNHHHHHPNNNTPSKSKKLTESDLFIKETSYLQAKYSFYINSYGNYTTSLSNPDNIVSWNKVEQAIYLLNQENEFQCPICFDPPLAPKMTKCGHIGCYGCLLRNLAHTNKCALCMKPIMREDLRSVKIIPVKKFEVGDEIQFNLLRYREGSTVPFLTKYDADGKLTDIPEIISFPSVSDDSSSFSRFSILTDIEDILKKEVEDLEIAIENANIDHEYQTLKYLNHAMKDIEERRNSFKSLVQSRAPQDNVIRISIPKNRNSHQFDSYQYSHNPEIRFALEEYYNSQYAGDSPSSNYSDSDWENYENSEHKNNNHSTTTTETTTSTTINNTNNKSSSQSTTSSEIIPLQVGTIDQSYDYEKQPFNGIYYLYQSDDSQDVYLHPLCVKLLSKEFLEKGEDIPAQLRSRILESETVEVTKALRHQYKILNVIPLTTPITFVEIDLTNIVSKATLDQFHTELSQRQHHRDNKKRQEVRKQRSKEKERLTDIKRAMEIREICDREKQIKMEEERIRAEQEKKEYEEYQKQVSILNQGKVQPKPTIGLQTSKFSSALDAITQHKNIDSNIEFPTLNLKPNK